MNKSLTTHTTRRRLVIAAAGIAAAGAAGRTGHRLGSGRDSGERADCRRRLRRGRPCWRDRVRHSGGCDFAE